MINAEFYKKEIFAITETGEGLALNTKKELVSCNSINCDYCKMKDENGCYSGMVKWLLAEHKEYPKLTRFQFELLNYMASDYGWIERDKNGSLYFYEAKPIKRESGWDTGIDNYVFVPTQLDALKFIKWEDEEPWNIQELLENCEVEE